MQTVILPEDRLAPAIEALKAGEVVAFPTETVYGLGANAQDPQACRKIFEAKGRPVDNPLIVHVLDENQLRELVPGPLPECAKRLVHAFWPGPLTLVLEADKRVSEVVRGGLPTVAVRAPNHPVARALIDGLKAPIAAPSANRSGRPSPTRATDVLRDLQGRVPYIIDGGDSMVGLESTIVDCAVDPPVLLRPGFIGRDRLEKVLGQPVLLAGPETTHRAPGMKYRHYAPQAPVIWLNMRDDQRIGQELDHLRQEFSTLALLAPLRWQAYPAQAFRPIGQDVNTVAHGLFTGFRELDDMHPGAIVVIWPKDTAGVGLAVANRLGKAASRQVEE
ncbi:threonylcarbamoyl-AMP synthase [Sulfobacillus sp. hq2]|nr:threonylcarbamoyl-AMP synthase [Sulfobacillus sp. hq2]